MIVLCIVALIMTVDLGFAGNNSKAKMLGVMASIQLLALAVYFGLGLFLVILLKRKTEMFSKGQFALWYVLHFTVFIFPTLAYFIVMLSFFLDPSYTPGNSA